MKVNISYKDLKFITESVMPRNIHYNKQANLIEESICQETSIW